MSIHLARDLENIKREILTYGGMVEEAINKSMTALTDFRPDIAYEVIADDETIDAKELEIEDFCMKTLALHQPVAGDLRFIVVVMKVTNDLERMGDLAVNISERATYLAKHPPLPTTLEFPEMVNVVRQMVRGSLDALVHQDIQKAQRVCQTDDDVDRMNRQMFKIGSELMKTDSTTVERTLQTLSASRHLERIADLATNIAEDVVFMVSGEVVKHREFPIWEL